MPSKTCMISWLITSTILVKSSLAAHHALCRVLGLAIGGGCLAIRAETLFRVEEGRVRDELGIWVELQSESRFVAEVDSAIFGQGLVEEQIAKRGRDGLAIRRVGLRSPHQRRESQVQGLINSRCTRRSPSWGKS